MKYPLTIIDYIHTPSSTIHTPSSNIYTPSPHICSVLPLCSNIYSLCSDIYGALQLPLDKREGVPHHLIDVQEPHDEFSAGEFYELARQATRDILEVI